MMGEGKAVKERRAEYDRKNSSRRDKRTGCPFLLACGIWFKMTRKLLKVNYVGMGYISVNVGAFWIFTNV